MIKVQLPILEATRSASVFEAGGFGLRIRNLVPTDNPVTKDTFILP